jgi:hypothetical protein
MALSADRNTPRAEGDIHSLGVAATQTIYAGAIVMRNASGYAVKATAALNLVGVGRAEERVINAGSAGDLAIKVRPGVFRFANSASADLITIADIGALAYAVDDQTVAKTSATNTRSPAGFVEAVDDVGVWVRFDEAAVRSYVALTAAIAAATA